MAALVSLMLKARSEHLAVLTRLVRGAHNTKHKPQPWSHLKGCLLAPSQSFLLDSVRFASKKSGGSCKNVGGKSPGRRYGFKKQDGNFVHAGNILATQRVMRYHPGAHVGLGTNKTLFALEDGYVRFTKEVFVPPPRSHKSQRIIPKLPQGALLYKTFINVLPLKQEGKFKLVDMV